MNIITDLCHFFSLKVDKIQFTIEYHGEYKHKKGCPTKFTYAEQLFKYDLRDPKIITEYRKSEILKLNNRRKKINYAACIKFLKKHTKFVRIDFNIECLDDNTIITPFFTFTREIATRNTQELNCIRNDANYKYL